MTMRIGFLGTGLMGAPMARRLAGAGFDLHVWNRNQDRARALADVATVAEHPQQAAEGADVVISMLLDGPATQAVLGDGAVIAATKPGAIVIDMGSVDPACDRQLADLAASRGRQFLDAPVSGGVVGAEAGSLAILVGGSDTAFAAAQPVFAPMGRATHLGPVGSGQAAKLANQLIVAITIGAVSEAMKLAEAAGCDPASFRAALQGGFADSRILELHGARMVARNFTPGGRSVAQLKDLRNALAFADEHNLTLPMGQAVTAAFGDFVTNRDGGEYDHSAYYLWLEMINGLPPRQPG